MKVLIVEDEALVAMSLEFLLKLEGHETIAIAQDYDSALTAVDRAMPDVALVDIQLARGTSGFDVAAELTRRGIATIFTTGNAPGEPRPDIAVGCLPKPYSDDCVFEALRLVEALIAGRGGELTSTSGFQLYRSAA
ncbi:MAG TPA: response regulator [Allosphingosinicella sp.]|jgi:CheY-like chemotaxis protein